MSRLRTYNIVMGILHAVQGVAVVALSNGFTLPVTEAFGEGPPGASIPAGEVLFDVDLGLAVALFLFLSAVFHLIIVIPPFHGRYLAGLEAGRNNFRWVEYSLSSSLMIVLIAMLTAIVDVAALIALFGVNAAMILFGALQEKYEQPGGSMTPFWLGSLVGAVPWLAIAVYLIGPGRENVVPGFVYGIFLSLFVFFNLFAINQWLQYRQVGRWRDYLYGERAYIALSLVAKSALAWQVFAGALAA